MKQKTRVKDEISKKVNEARAKTSEVVNTLKTKDLAIKFYVMVFAPSKDIFNMVAFRYSLKDTNDFIYKDGIYTLIKPAMTYLGKPTYWIREGYNLSITLETLDRDTILKYVNAMPYTDMCEKMDDLLETIKMFGNKDVAENEVLIEKGNNPRQMYTITHNQVSETVYGIAKKSNLMDKMMKIAFALATNVITGLIVYMICAVL